MEEHELSPDQRARIEAIEREFERQLARVGVEPREAFPRLNHAEVERQISDEEFEVLVTIDVSGILAVLRQLPDGAGTLAFVAAYNAAHPGVGRRPSNEP